MEWNERKYGFVTFYNLHYRRRVRINICYRGFIDSKSTPHIIITLKHDDVFFRVTIVRK